MKQYSTPSRNKKTSVINPKLLSANRHGGNPTDAVVTLCDNMRLNNGLLEVIGHPAERTIAEHADHAGRHLVAIIDTGQSGRVALFDRLEGSKLGYAFIDTPQPAIQLLGDDPGDIITAISIGCGRIALLTATTILHVDIDADRLVMAGRPGRLPLVRFNACDAEFIEVTIPERKLTGRYSADSRRLSTADAAAMGRDAVAGINALIDLGARAGKMTQSVALRYRLVDSRGQTLYQSLPTVVSGQAGVNFASERSAALSDDLSLLNQWSVRCSAFHIKADWSADISTYITDPDARTRISAMVIEVSQPLHTIDPDVDNPGYLTPRAGGGLTAHYTPCGINSLHGNAGHRLDSLLAGVLGSDESFSTLAVIDRPWQQADRGLILPVPASMAEPIEAQSARLKRLCRTSAKLGRLDALTRLPNRFTARLGVCTGNTVMWGDITPCTYTDISVGRLTADSTDAPWSGSLEVIMADGSHRVLTNEQGATAAPLSIIPLIAYPDPDARQIRITVTRSGMTFRRVLDLTLSSDGSTAFYVTPDGLPLDIDQPADPDDLSAATMSAPERFEGGLIAARLADPYIPTGSAMLDRSLTALAAPPRRASAYDSGRLRILAAGQGGISVVTVSDDCRSVLPQPLDARPVTSQSAVTVTGLAHMPLIMVAGGDLISFNRGSVSTLVAGIGDGAVAWDSVDSELWYLNPREGCPRIFNQSVTGHYRFPALSAGRIFTTIRGVVAEDDEWRLLDTATGRSTDLVNIKWEATLNAPIDPSTGYWLPLRALNLPLFMASATGGGSVTAVISGCDTPPRLPAIPETVALPSRPRRLIVSHRITGVASTPTVCPALLAPRLQWLTLSVTGKVSPLTAGRPTVILAPVTMLF